MAFSYNLGTIGATVTLNTKQWQTGIGSIQKDSLAAGAAIAALAATISTTLTKVIKNSIKAYSDYIETLNLFVVTFGKQSTQMQAWAKQTGKAIGVTSEEMMRFSGTTKLMIESLDVLPAVATESSKQLTKLMVDIASFRNKDFQEVFIAVSNAVAGIYRNLRRFGVVITANMVEQRALANTSKLAVKELTEEDKVTARIQLVMERFRKDSGDMIRTQYNLANQVRRFHSNMSELGILLGGQIAKVWQPLLIIINKVLQALRSLGEEHPGILAGLATGAIAIPTIAVGSKISSSPAVQGMIGGLGFGAASAGTNKLMSMAGASPKQSPYMPEEQWKAIGSEFDRLGNTKAKEIFQKQNKYNRPTFEFMREQEKRQISVYKKEEVLKDFQAKNEERLKTFTDSRSNIASTIQKLQDDEIKTTDKLNSVRTEAHKKILKLQLDELNAAAELKRIQSSSISIPQKLLDDNLKAAGELQRIQNEHAKKGVGFIPQPKDTKELTAAQQKVSDIQNKITAETQKASQLKSAQEAAAQQKVFDIKNKISNTKNRKLYEEITANQKIKNIQNDIVTKRNDELAMISNINNESVKKLKFDNAAVRIAQKKKEVDLIKPSLPKMAESIHQAKLEEMKDQIPEIPGIKDYLKDPFLMFKKGNFSGIIKKITSGTMKLFSSFKVISIAIGKWALIAAAIAAIVTVALVGLRLVKSFLNSLVKFFRNLPVIGEIIDAWILIVGEVWKKVKDAASKIKEGAKKIWEWSATAFDYESLKDKQNNAIFQSQYFEREKKINDEIIRIQNDREKLNDELSTEGLSRERKREIKKELDTKNKEELKQKALLDQIPKLTERYKYNQQQLEKYNKILKESNISYLKELNTRNIISKLEKQEQDILKGLNFQKQDEINNIIKEQETRISNQRSIESEANARKKLADELKKQYRPDIEFFDELMSGVKNMDQLDNLSQNKMFKSFAEKFKDIDDKELRNELINNLGNINNKMVKIYDKNLDKLSDRLFQPEDIPDVSNDLITGFLDQYNEMPNLSSVNLDDIANSTTDLLDFFNKAQDKIINSTVPGDILELGAKVGQSIASAYESYLQKIEDGIAVSPVDETFFKNYEEMTKYFSDPEFINEINTALEDTSLQSSIDTINKVTEYLSTIGKFSEGIDIQQDQSIKHLKGIYENIEKYNTKSEEFKKYTETAIKKIDNKKYFDPIVTITDFLQHTLEELTSAVPGASDNEVVLEYTNKIKKEIDKFNNIPDISQKMYSFENLDLLYANLLKDTIPGAIGSVDDSILNAINSLVDTYFNGPPPGEGYSFENMDRLYAKLLKDAIPAAVGWVDDSVLNAIDSLVSDFVDSPDFDINSPFENFNKLLDITGLKEAITNAGGWIDDSILEYLDGVVKSFDEFKTKVLSDMFKEMDTAYTENEKEIQDISKELNDYMTNKQWERYERETTVNEAKVSGTTQGVEQLNTNSIINSIFGKIQKPTTLSPEQQKQQEMVNQFYKLNGLQEMQITLQKQLINVVQNNPGIVMA